VAFEIPIAKSALVEVTLGYRRIFVPGDEVLNCGAATPVVLNASIFEVIELLRFITPPEKVPVVPLIELAVRAPVETAPENVAVVPLIPAPAVSKSKIFTTYHPTC